MESEKYLLKSHIIVYSIPNKGKFKDTFGFEISHWQESLCTCLNQMRSSNE